MDRLKAELRQLAQHDGGTPEDRDNLIDSIILLLQRYFTDEMINTFSGWEVRGLIINYLKRAEEVNVEAALKELPQHIHLSSIRRQLPAETMNAQNVVSIFGRP